MMEWTEHAACRGSDPELFFPERPNSATSLLALQLCSTCKVSAECYKVAASNLMIQGIWGGTTQLERQQLQRRRR